MPIKNSIPIIRLATLEGKRLLAGSKILRDQRDTDAQRRVEKIITDIRIRGDKALFFYTKQFDKVSLSPSSARVSEQTIHDKQKSP